MPLVPLRPVLDATVKYGYAQGAFNVNAVAQAEAVIAVHEMFRSPAILQGADLANAFMGGRVDFANGTLEDKKKGARNIAEAVKKFAEQSPIPVVLHLDHGKNFDSCVAAIEGGYTSVMIDGSHLPYEENIALTKKVVDYAHQFDVTVEGELGVLAGIEDDVKAEHHTYTEPDQVVDFVSRTGVDSLAISIGTSHGANKFTPEQCTRDANGVLVPPPLRFDILQEIEKRIPGFPIVLHGSSSVPQDLVAVINKYGGALKDAIGIPEEQLRKAAESAVCKINIDSDGRLAMTAAVREVLATKPAEFDPRKYLGPARESLKKLYEHKLINVLGSAGKVQC